MARAGIRTLAFATGTLLVLAGCEDGGQPFSFLKGADSTTTEGQPQQASSVTLVDRDVEAPEVFQVADQGLWDGRPSLGGVWVASPDAIDPERVIIRNPGNGKFVIGALFRRERENPGPTLQISSDAAAALGMLAGQPAALSVTALRREEVPVTAPDAANPILDAAEAIETQPLDPVATAAAALDKVENSPAPAQHTTAAATTTKPMARPEAKPVTKPAATSAKLHLQIGIFSVEANAKRAAASITKAGIPAEIKKESSQGKTFWRVVAGPAASAADREALLTKVKGLGFADAYFVSR